MNNDFAPVTKSSHNLETSQATITMTPEMFALLSSGVYTHKERAVIRELSCNCLDAHKAAGKVGVPFKVHLPTLFEPFFEVRDYGTGMTHEQVMKLYLDYGNSTKNNSNDYIGAMGIGSKSPFAIAQSFTVSSYVDGTVRKYSIYMEEGLPQITLLTTNPTDEENGLAVRVAVSDDRRDKFRREAGFVYSYFEEKPECNIEYPDIFENMNLIVQREGVYQAYSNSETYNRRGGLVVNAIMGSIAYPIDLTDIFEVPDFMMKSLDMINIHLPIGSVAITASREALQMNDATREKIKEVMELIVESLVEDTIEDVANSPTLYTAAQKYYTLRHNSNGLFKHVFEKLEWGGMKLVDLEEKLQEIRKDYIIDDKGNKVVDLRYSSNTTGKVVYQKEYKYPPLTVYNYRDLNSRIRATKAKQVYDSLTLSMFDFMREECKDNTIFIINDRLNKNGKIKTTYNNHVTLGIMKHHIEKGTHVGYRYNLSAIYFEDEAELQENLRLHMLDKVGVSIYKMSDFVHCEPERSMNRGTVKLLKALYDVEDESSYTKEVTQNLDDIEEPQYYIRATGDHVEGFLGDLNWTSRTLANLLKQDVYIFRKANWKKIPEDWVEVTDQVAKESIEPYHWINFNRYIISRYMSTRFDIRDYGVVCVGKHFAGKTIHEGSVWRREDKVELYNHFEELEQMFGRISYIAAPLVYSSVAKGSKNILPDMLNILQRGTDLSKAIKNAEKRMRNKIVNFIDNFEEKNFLLSNLDWNKVDIIEVAKFLNISLKSIEQEELEKTSE